jgi:hypothetical protein
MIDDDDDDSFFFFFEISLVQNLEFQYPVVSSFMTHDLFFASLRPRSAPKPAVIFVEASTKKEQTRPENGYYQRCTSPKFNRKPFYF